MKFEHALAKMFFNDDGTVDLWFRNLEIRQESADKALTAIGAEGWEAVSMTVATQEPVPSFERCSQFTSVRILFKRQEE